MSTRLEDLIVRLKKRHPYLAFVIGGGIILLDNVGRAQIIKDLYANVRTYWGTIHAMWPSHALTWAGAAFIAYGLISLFLPEKDNVPSVEAPAYPPLPKVEAAVAEQPRRIFLGKTTTVEYLQKLFRENTEIQANKLVGDYIGKWIRVSGCVVNVSSIAQGIQVLMRPRKSEKRPDEYVQLHFGADWIDRVSILRPDEEISAIGQLNAVSGLWISLKNCEFGESE